MSLDLYQKELLRLAGDARRAGRLTPPCCSGRETNPMCGDSVTIDLRIEDGRVTDASHDVKGCILVQAAASLICEEVVGRPPAVVGEIRDKVAAMLEGGNPPSERWAAFSPATAYRSRHTCVLLPLEAAKKAAA